jgi:hypothetical protein
MSGTRWVLPLCSIAACMHCHAQQDSQPKAQNQPVTPCIQPAPMVRWQDYQGPLRKMVGAFGRTLDRQSIRSPRYKPGTVLCSLELKDKFLFFVQDTYEPLSFLTAGFNAAMDQAEDNDRKFGQGGEGYAARFGANFADQASARFFGDFAYPVIFSEDPRYYRLGSGTPRRRLLHALGHTLIGHRDNGSPMFNYSLWLGTASAVAIGRTYHTSGPHGVGSMAESVTYFVAEGMGFDVLREFWPEIARKLKMPFRDARQPTQPVP